MYLVLKHDTKYVVCTYYLDMFRYIKYSLDPISSGLKMLSGVIFNDRNSKKLLYFSISVA